LAGEVWATFKDTDKPFAPPTPTFNGVDGDTELSVEIAEPELCSRYVAAVVRNVKIAPSPKFIRERLKASGVRPINNLVDITNFVMLEYGHPMHAFDKRYVTGNHIIVRKAADGEKITLLDGETRTLTPLNLVIADTEKPIAVAGVMGGEYSGIMPDTTDVIFEAACFDGVSVRRTAKQIGRRTDASARFEKDLDPVNAYNALLRALELTEKLGAGEVVKTIIDVDKSVPKDRSVLYTPNIVSDILGIDIPDNEQFKILERLGFTHRTELSAVTRTGFQEYATPPPTRLDIKSQCDIAEEVARIYGYNNIPSKPCNFSLSGEILPEERYIAKLREAAVAVGFFETLTSSFVSEKQNNNARTDNTHSVKIRNPLGEETALLRVSSIPSALTVLANAKGKGQYFEVLRVYEANGEVTSNNLPKERQLLSVYGGGYGNNGFYEFKGAVEEILSALPIKYPINYAPSANYSAYHPGRCAEISVEVKYGQSGDVIGVFGEIHPSVSGAYDIKGRVYSAEIDLDKLFVIVKQSGDVKYKPLPKYPALNRDLSLVCDKTALSGDVLKIVKQSGGKILESAELFDIFTGGSLPDDKKALAYGLVFRKPDGTLSDGDADAAINKILKNLGKQGVVLRT
jgi:phenylalanyl-tRNA synthetase beta chain